MLTRWIGRGFGVLVVLRNGMVDVRVDVMVEVT